MINEVVNLKNGLSLVYGEGATGKTTLALMLAYEHSKFSKVIFIDTENGFNFDRFKQISQENYEKCLNNILLIKVKDFDDQVKAIKNLAEIKNVSLIIIDSLGMYYRLELKKDVKNTNNNMGGILSVLRTLNKNGINIFITNQVYNNFNNNKLEVVGGNMVRTFCKSIMRLEKNPRKIVVEKPSNLEWFFEIKDQGIVLR